MMQVLLGALIGTGVGFVLANALIQSGKAERYSEAYEEGWTHGYDVGLKAPRPKRVKTIRKADA